MDSTLQECLAPVRLLAMVVWYTSEDPLLRSSTTSSIGCMLKCKSNLWLYSDKYFVSRPESISKRISRSIQTRNFRRRPLVPRPDIRSMHLMYSADEMGNRIYTLKKVTMDGKITKSAHPARFSPDDKYSRQRVTLKKRFGLLLTQQSEQQKPW